MGARSAIPVCWIIFMGAMNPAMAAGGAWSGTFQLPIIPVAAAMLPTGNIVVWSSNMTLTFEGDIGTMPSNTLMAVLNPTTGTVTPALDSGVAADMFCPGVATLPDGRLLVNGGSSSSHTSVYSPFAGQNGTWGDAKPMNNARGYNSNVTLSNGSVFTIGGSWSGSPDQTRDGEVWSPNVGWQLTDISGTLVLGPELIDQAQGWLQYGDDHTWLFAMPNGRVFFAGPANQMWFFNPFTGAATEAGTRGNDPYSINGVAVMYEPGKIFKAGGAQAYTNDPTLLPTPVDATNSAYIIDITANYTNQTAQPVVTQIAPINHARSFANGVVLPDGEVFLVGGQSKPHSFHDDNAVMTPELWNPVTQKSIDLASMPTPRNYHSTALLIPDGRVFVGGGGQCGDCFQDDGTTPDPTANHLNYELYSPPYLFAANGSLAARPTITTAPLDFTLGDPLAVNASTNVTAFSLVRLGSATHTVDTDQRRIPLSITSNASGKFVLTAPSDPGITVPGYYMLFALNANNVPSIASIIHVSP